ncbi:SUKH-4 family immunity protein [Streptomyces sp. NPDC020801]|uniref:SUKH-4 family immunity protein n=1 Tax=Streptomyces sp. NPDC020801 TaxID=3365093 RepID=UPI0037A1B2BA
MSALLTAEAPGRDDPAEELADLRARFASRAGRHGQPGLTLDLPSRLLDEEFGKGRVARFEDVDFPVTLTHEPTRRFLRETGLPEDGLLFQLDTEVPLPTLAEYYAHEHPDGFPPAGLPARADHLIRLGRLAADSSLAVDGTTGKVWNWSEADATPYPLDEDLSTLVFSLWLLHRTLGGRGGNRTRVARFAGLSMQVRA